MDTWGRPATVSYKRWRNPSSSDDFAGHGDEVQGTDYEICTISTDQFNNPGGGGAPSSPGPKKKEVTFTVDEAVEAIGFGKFQFKISLLTGLAWVADAMEMMILSILGPQLHCEWRLPGYQVALITSVVFLGMALSSYVWGRLSDKYGRKTGLMLCMTWTLYYSLLCAFAPIYIWLLILRGLVGFGIGGAAQSVTLYSEFLPKKSRGISVMMMTAFWAIGTVAEVLLALLVMPTLGWRWLLGLSAVPMAIFVCFSIWLPESPRFDILMGRREKATATLERIAKENAKAMPRGKMVAYKQTSRGRLRHLLAPQYRRTTLLLWFIWFSFAFSYYGVVLLTTELFQSGDSCGVAQVAKNEPACSLECKYLTTADYKDLLWTTLAEFPGLLVILGAVDCIGRKKSMALCFFMFTLSILPLYACIGRIALTIFIFIARAFISGGYQVAFVYTPEVFPTEIRALAMGTSSGVARLGALITPFVAQVLLRSSVYLTMSVYCGCSLLAGVASLLLPIETLGRSMQESDQDQNQNQDQDQDQDQDQGASIQT